MVLRGRILARDGFLWYGCMFIWFYCIAGCTVVFCGLWAVWCYLCRIRSFRAPVLVFRLDRAGRRGSGRAGRVDPVRADRVGSIIVFWIVSSGFILTYGLFSCVLCVFVRPVGLIGSYRAVSAARCLSEKYTIFLVKTVDPIPIFWYYICR